MQMEMVQLYNWSPVDEMIDTGQWGRITIAEWLQRELARIAADPIRRAEIRRQGQFASLFVDKPLHRMI